MTPRFFISEKKLPLAVKQALLSLFDSSDYGEISSIGFKFGSPSRNRLPFQVVVDGHIELQCEPCDTYPLLEKLRSWMERCMVFDRNGALALESVKIECLDDVYTLTLLHAGWIRLHGISEPVSAFIILRSGSERPAICRFCLARQLISHLYMTITEGILRHRGEFNDARKWYDVKRADALDSRDTATRMLERISSEKLEKLAAVYMSLTGGHKYDGR